MSRTPVAFFDFDGTLTRGDSLFPFIRYVVGPPRFLGGLLVVAPVLAGFISGLVPRQAAKEAVLRHYFRGRDIDALREQGERFAAERIPHMLRVDGMERLRWHRQRGHHCVLVSASLDLYLEPWSRTMGFTDVLVSSLQADSLNRATGRLDGANCHGPVKRERIQAWLSRRACGHTYAYGDSRGDLPMLEMVDEGWILSGGRYIRQKS